MSVIAATTFFHSYGVKCDYKLVEEWLNSTAPNSGLRENFCEDDLYDFNEWCRLKDTAYEEGIDDKTKIERLIEEIHELKSEVARLQNEKVELQHMLRITPF